MSKNANVDVTQENIESVIRKWTAKRTEAIRLHNCCHTEENNIRDMIWVVVKEREAVVTALQSLLRSHIDNKETQP
jgi:hypothetical protein